MAVVLLATYSCVQDTTHDEVPVVTAPGQGSSGEVKTLQVALPVPSRTELGDKDVNGKYPVYWCVEEGKEDVLAVNGEPTTKIELVNPDSNNRSSVAIFDMPLQTSIPYNIVYPYAEGVEVDAKSGMYPVRFLSEQVHTEGSFALGSAPMYAWSDGFSEVQMHHLATVLRFSLKAKDGQEVSLRHISVSTIEAEPITGIFDVYCGSSDENDTRAGEIVARDGANTTVFYTFEGDAHTLTSQTEDFYVVVPKGSYAGFEVNFVTNDGGVCVRTFNATGELALLGGKVREFPVIEFEVNSKMMMIGTDADMLTFAEEVKAGTFSSKYDGALLVSDVDMSQQTWTALDGFDSVFEGRNHTITGLTQPLFGENVVATISNLNVEGTVAETTNTKVGLIARSLVANGEKVGKIFNCSAKGTISYSNTETAVTNKLDFANIGGLVGGLYGGNVSLSKSSVDISIDAAGPNGETKAFLPCIGGVVGYASALNGTAPVVVENVNKGSVAWNDNSACTNVRPYIGGVAGYVVAGEFADNANEAVLTVAKPLYDLDWGGVLGASKVSVERCVNRGSMTIAQDITTANIGGVLGSLERNATASIKNSISDCDNYGKLLFDEEFFITSSCNIGGVVAEVVAGTYSVDCCDNYGEITYKGNCKSGGATDLAGKGNASIRLGGVVALCCSEILSDCHNKAGANIDIAGSLSGVTNYSNSQVNSSIAGVVASRSATSASLKITNLVLTEKCSNAGKIHCAFEYRGRPIIAVAACIGVLDSDEVVDCHNAETGELLYATSVYLVGNGVTATRRGEVYVSGLIANLFSNCDRIENCSNSGTIKYDNASCTDLYISGLLGYSLGYASVVLTNCYNNGDIVVGENTTCDNLMLGGLAAATETYRSCSFEGCYNAKNVVAKANVTVDAYVGGLFGLAVDANKAGAAPRGIYNSGTVRFEGIAPTVYLGGYSGKYQDDEHGIQFSNTGSVEFEYDENATIDNIYIGGYAGYAEIKKASTATSSADSTFEIINSGNINVSGYAKNIYASGVVGYLSAETGVTGMTNTGTVELEQDEKASADNKYPENIYLGGLFGGTRMSGSTSSYIAAVRACDNEGSIIYKGFARDGAYVGGLVGKASTTTLAACENRGSIVSSGHAGDWASRISEADDKKRRYEPMLRHDLAIGGVVGETDYNIEGCANDGAVTHTCLPNPLKIDLDGLTASSRFDIGGVAGRVYTESTSQTEIKLATVTNKANGKITIYGSPEATTNSSSIDMSSGKVQSNDVNDYDRANAVIGYRMNVGGIAGRIFDNIVKSGDAVNNVALNLVNCSNEADISLPEATRAKNLNVAGAVGDILATFSTFTDVKNSGNITVDKVGFGTSQATTTMHPSYFTNMGGIAGLCYDARFRKNAQSTTTGVHTFNNCENSGKLYYGEVGASFFQTAGGILGQALQFYGPMAWTGSNTAVYYKDMSVEFNNCTNSGDIQYYSEMVSVTYNYSYGGGILGNSNNPVSSYAQFLGAVDVAIRNCTNHGNIQFDRSNGYVSTNASDSYSSVGGMVGYFCGGHGVPSFDIYTRRARSEKKIENGGAYSLLIESCRNTGRVWTCSGAAGGMIGRAYWFVKVTGTEDNPTVNEGDIVVARSGGNVVLRNNYGSKIIYAGGIAGVLTEYSANTRYLFAYKDNDAADEGNPQFDLGTQYVRVEYAVNKGSVGATDTAGGIVGFFRSTKYAAPVIGLTDVEHKGGIEFCRNEGDIYSLEGATSKIGAIIGGERMASFTKYSSTSTLIQDDSGQATAMAEKIWPQGVANCQIGGTLLRGANRKITPDADTFQDCIYGDMWLDEFVSNVSGKENKYDGCTFYSTQTPGETPEDPEGGTDESVVRR